MKRSGRILFGLSPHRELDVVITGGRLETSVVVEPMLIIVLTQTYIPSSLLVRNEGGDGSLCTLDSINSFLRVDAC